MLFLRRFHGNEIQITAAERVDANNFCHIFCLLLLLLFFSLRSSSLLLSLSFLSSISSLPVPISFVDSIFSSYLYLGRSALHSNRLNQIAYCDNDDRTAAIERAN